MSYEKEEEERSEINRDHVVVRGCKNTPRMVSFLTTHSSLLTYFSTPSPAKLVPSPYTQGESAMRTFFKKMSAPKWSAQILLMKS